MERSDTAKRGITLEKVENTLGEAMPRPSLLHFRSRVGPRAVLQN